MEVVNPHIISPVTHPFQKPPLVLTIASRPSNLFQFYFPSISANRYIIQYHHPLHPVFYAIQLIFLSSGLELIPYDFGGKERCKTKTTKVLDQKNTNSLLQSLVVMHFENFNPSDTNEWLTQLNGNNLIFKLTKKNVDNRFYLFSKHGYTQFVSKTCSHSSGRHNVHSE